MQDATSSCLCKSNWKLHTTSLCYPPPKNFSNWRAKHPKEFKKCEFSHDLYNAKTQDFKILDNAKKKWKSYPFPPHPNLLTASRQGTCVATPRGIACRSARMPSSNSFSWRSPSRWYFCSAASSCNPSAPAPSASECNGGGGPCASCK